MPLRRQQHSGDSEGEAEGAPAPAPAERPESAPAERRYSRPKVMLIDVPAAALAQVQAAGYHVVIASLGTPLTVDASDRFLAVQANGRLPGFAEQEVVVVQQRPPDARPGTPDDVPAVTDQTEIWSSTRDGVIDSRPWLAQYFSEDAQRILDHGGVFIFFCDPPRQSNLVSARSENVYGRVQVNADLPWTVWDLLPELNSFDHPFDHGEEITPTPPGFLDVLAPHLASATFNCTLDPGRRKDRWVPIAHNKYGKVVAGVLGSEPREPPDGNGKRGYVVLLPQVQDIGACVLDLLDNVLPRLVPTLFPESERTAWLRSETYELPGVLGLQTEIERLRADAEEREAELRDAIERERERDGWTHTLLTGTDDELVDAVVSALGVLGLKDVRKIDDEEEERQSGRRREDLQVWDASPLILGEVKGISNVPKEASSLQVWKYLTPRMRKLDRLDIRGLAIINHQRGLPPLERENVHTFQQDVLDNAEEQGFGLLTTLDLFRLVRNKQRWGWPDETVIPLLYGNGRVLAIPVHYELVGAVTHFFEGPGAVIVEVTASGFSVKEDLAFVLPIDYVQERVESIQLDDAAVDSAAVGDVVGIKTGLTKTQARNGVAVYRLRAVD